MLFRTSRPVTVEFPVAAAPVRSIETSNCTGTGTVRVDVKKNTPITFPAIGNLP